MENPYNPPQSNLEQADNINDTGINSVRIGQKLIIFAILAHFASTALSQLNPLWGYTSLIAFAMAICGLFLLGKGMKAPLWLKALTVILIIIPLINIITLLILNSRATKKLKAAGYKVGLAGAYKKTAA